ncbi:uncharacterized protein CANTADRAFT_39238, partial [Suhomyces tanzawaensis NRRL Y-17324]
EESNALQQSLDELASLEKDMSVAERDSEVFRIKRTQHIYASRRDILNKIPTFWYIVLAENDDFAEYISVEDLKYLELIDNIYVHYNIADIENPSEDDLKHFKDFYITIDFSSKDGVIPDQKVTKHFKTIIEDGEEKIISEPVDIKWPHELDAINPALIKKNKGKQLSADDKKNYRLGMKSFFSWFAWTGEKPGKEFRNGEDLTRLIVDDLFLNATKYYVLALPNDEDSDDSNEDDSSEGEELDLSDDEV